MPRPPRLLPALLTLALGAAPLRASAGPSGWWHSGYWVDYGLLAAGAGAYLGLSQLSPRDDALIGPVYDPADPTAVLDADLSDRIGRTHLDQDEGETVPESVFYAVIPALFVVHGAEDLLVPRSDHGLDRHDLHDTLIGLSEATLLTLGVTEVFKVTVGRLRPDFQDRYRRYACTGDDPPGGDVCPADGLRPLAADRSESEHLLEDGRKSFPSGHSSMSFALATYSSLVVGGHFVWGEGATSGSRTLGLAAQTALMGTAAFTAASRVDDGRHHFGDVLTGSAIGFGLAHLAYWRHFDAGGRPRDDCGGGAQVRVTAGPGDAGVALVMLH